MSDIFIKIFSCTNGYAMALIAVLFFVVQIKYLNKIYVQGRVINELKGRFKIENHIASKIEIELHRIKLIEADNIINSILKRTSFLMLSGVIVFAAILLFRIFNEIGTHPNDFIYTFSFCMILLWMVGITCGIFCFRSAKKDSLHTINVELGSAPKKIMQGYIKLLEEKVESMNRHLLLLEREERGLTILEAYDMIEGISLVNSAIKAELKEYENVTIKK